MPQTTETKNLPEATITDVDPKDAESDTDSEDTIPELEDPGTYQKHSIPITRIPLTNLHMSFQEPPLPWAQVPPA